MRKTSTRATVIFGIITLSFMAIYLMVAIKFFTKDNEIMKSTIESKKIACVQQEKILEKTEESKNDTQTEVTMTHLSTNTNKTKNTNKEKQGNKQEDAVSKTTEETTKPENIEKVESVSTTSNVQESSNNNAQKANEETSKNELAMANMKTSSKQENVVTSYKGLPTIGKISIPKTGVNQPIMSSVTAKGMEIAPCFLFSTGKLNQKGNTLIVGHNYNNIFTNNKKLQIGDKIIVTTIDGKTVEYTIYKKFETNPEDLDYVIDDSTNEPKIMLSTCTSNDNVRLVIMAK